MTEKAAIYARVSTEEQAGEGKVSIEVQRSRCEALCEAREWEVFEIYVDAGVSGAKEDRPALNRMLRDGEAGVFDRLVYLKSDRLARNTRLLLQIWEMLEQVGVKVISVEEGFDTGSPAGQMAITMMAATAQFEREQIRERVKMGKHGMAKRGLYPSGIPPYGYDYDAATKKLVVNPAEAKIVRRIYSLYLDEGLGVRAITRLLNEEHVPTRGLGVRSKDGKRKGWLPAQVGRILKRSTCKGEWQYARRHTDRFGNRHPNAEEDMITVEVPAIVSVGGWELVRKKAERNRHHGMGHEKKLFYLLRGMLCCDECGRSFKATGTPAGRKRRNGGKPYTVRTEQRGYYCRGQDQSPHLYNCRKPKQVKAEHIEGPVWAAVENALRNPELLRTAAAARLGEIQAADSNSSDLIAKRRRQLERAAKERDGVVSLAARGDITSQDLRIRLEKLDADTEMWQGELNRLVAAANWREQAQEVTQLLEEFCQDIGPTLDVMTREERRELLLALVDKVWLDGEGNIRIEGVIPYLDDAGNTAPQVYTAASRGRGVTPACRRAGAGRGEGVVPDGAAAVAVGGGQVAPGVGGDFVQLTALGRVLCCGRIWWLPR